MSKIACVTGATGQIGSYVCETLLEQEYKVYALKRRSSSVNSDRVDHIFSNKNFEMIYGDLTDPLSINSFVGNTKPDIFINCGAQSHVRIGFDIPSYTMEATGNSVLNCLEAIKNISPKTRFVTCSSSEMYGSAPAPQNENTPFQPQSVYAIAKIMGYHLVRNYRDAYKMFAANGILFNTESPRRAWNFAPKKITLAACRIKLGLQDKLLLGNLAARRDWQHSRDSANALYKIVTADEPDDYCVASGESHSVQELVEIVFGKLGLDWKKYVGIDPRYYRPTEVDDLRGDETKIKEKLGFERKYTFEMLVNEMIENDMKLAEQELLIKNNSK